MPSKAPPAAKPSRSIFDPFNSSATGHQRAENRLSGSISWRDSRSLKLREQFSSGAGGGKRVSDTVGAGSLDFGKDGRTENGGWIPGAKGLRTGGQRSLWECMRIEKAREVGCGEERSAKRAKIEQEDAQGPASQNPTAVVNPFTPFRRSDGTVRESSWTSHEASPSEFVEPIFTRDSQISPHQQSEKHTLDENTERNDDEPAKDRPALQIFANLNFYINGSTAPYSDHQIKHLLSKHGGRISVSLGRRTVTHVILGRPQGPHAGGSGGGLAATKIQKEIARTSGNQRVKYVNVDWVASSVRAGKRVPESRFEAMKLAPKGVGGISSIFQPVPQS